MILQNWWYTTLLNAKQNFCPPLRGSVSCDVAVIGGGMAGLHAAQRLIDSGKDVVLLEKNICGGSSTGKSAGFLTPDSELELHQIMRRYGKEDAKKVWGMAETGVELIANNIKKYNFKCDFQKQDSLFVGIKKSGMKQVREEVEVRKSMGFKSTYYESEQLKRINSGLTYSAGVRYDDTYSINPLLYAQELKGLLLSKGVRIYESTEVTGLNKHTVKTHLGNVKAEHIIFCIDKMEKSLSYAANEVYHAQTFLSISEPLSKKDINRLFPSTRNVMCFDSKLVYTYYRLTGDNRLLLGGGSALTTFSPVYVNSPRVINKVIREFHKNFPFLKHLKFIQYWPGLIDTTKDLIPIVDFDPKCKHVQYVLGCVGLPWAAFCGDYAAKRYLDPKCRTHCHFLKWNRKFLISYNLQKILGKMITFSLNNAYSKYLQKDQ